jgi:hypothetical protein
MYAKFVVAFFMLLLTTMHILNDVLLFTPMIATLLSFVTTIVIANLM